jgi:hypothetical protein
LSCLASRFSLRDFAAAVLPDSLRADLLPMDPAPSKTSVTP